MKIGSDTSLAPTWTRRRAMRGADEAADVKDGTGVDGVGMGVDGVVGLVDGI
ncbi:MAG: hypothetical protein KBG28_25275 [Kofleriaceae bacterium]|jgi:hypothetical protein|nr:hypothetical protein [Kofleriaceae bacterium]MBP9207306.1 hypothetical protein [Kofleriaceae bacterium]